MSIEFVTDLERQLTARVAQLEEELRALRGVTVPQTLGVRYSSQLVVWRGDRSCGVDEFSGQMADKTAQSFAVSQVLLHPGLEVMVAELRRTLRGPSAPMHVCRWQFGGV